MSRKVLEDWLQTDEAKVVGQQVGGSEAEDHELGAGSSNYSTKRSPTTQITTLQLTLFPRVIFGCNAPQGFASTTCWPRSRGSSWR